MTSLTAQRRLDLSNYTMVWNDEFNYQGTPQQIHYQMFDAPDAKWIEGFTYGPFWYADDDDKRTLCSRNNVEVHNEHLYLKAKAGSGTKLFNGTNYNYKRTAGIITSKYNKDYMCLASWDMGDNIPWNDSTTGFNYGIFEIRAKLPRKENDFSAFWLWSGYWQCGNAGSDSSCLSPRDSTEEFSFFPGWEIDVFEAKQSSNPEDFAFWSTVQANKLMSPTPCIDCATYYDWKNSDPGKTFHTYTLAWTPNSITWFIDGNEIRSQYKNASDGIPLFKMNLILHAEDINGGNSDPLIVDYVRVYRPKNVNYALNSETYTHFNNSVSSTYTNNFIWRNRFSNDRQIYENIFSNTPYTVNQNYRKPQDANPVLLSNIFGDAPRALVVHNLSPSVARLYYTKPDNKLYRVTNVSNNFSTPSVITTGLHPETDIAVHLVNGNVYWKDNSNRLKVLYWTGSSSYGIGNVDVSWQYPNDVKGGITVSPSNNYHGTRIYYISTNNNRLCYYEYCSGWYRHETPVTNVEELAISNNPEGKIFYKGSDNHVWTIWKYWDTNTTCSSSNPVSGWSYAPLDVPYDSTYADCSRDLAIHPDGHQIFYRTLDGELAYWDLQNSPVRIRSNVWGVAGNIIVNKTLDGRTEVFYVANNTGDPFNFRFKIKTYYERTAPQVDNKTQWQDATLDVFSPGVGGVGPNANYETGYYTGSNIALNNSHPTKVFCTYSTSNNIFGYYLGAYKESTNWNPLPQTPYEECLPVPFEIGNRFYNGFHIGLEGKVQNLDNEGLSENYETIETEEDGFFEEDNLNSDIIISPNPTTGFLNVDISGAWVNGNIQVFDGQGKLLIEKDKIINQIRLDISAYPKGIYLVRVYKAEEYVSRLILKQ